MSEHTAENGAHEHDVACAFGSPTCPAFREEPEPRPSLWRRWMRRHKRPAGGIDLAVDRDGNRYTTRCFADYGDPWWGATILTSGVVRDLRERDLLPLTECVTPPAETTTARAGHGRNAGEAL